MKIVRTILVILAILLILLNLLSYINGRVNIPEGTSHAIAYLIGRNAAFILGGILLLIAWFIDKRIGKNKRKKMLDSFLK